MSWLLVILVFLLASIKTTKGSDKSVSIVIPAYNEEATVAKVVSVARKLSYVDEVIVVDDKGNKKPLSIGKENLGKCK